MSKRILSILFLLAFAAIASGVERITALVTVTNAPSTNGHTLVITTTSTSTRYYTNAVSATTILTNTTIGGSFTNMFNQLAAYPPSGCLLSYVGTNSLRLIGYSGGNLDVTLSTNLGTVALSTQTVADLTPVRVPLSAEPAVNTRTNVASELVNGINLYATNSFTTNSTALANYVGITTTQTVSGVKTFTGIVQLTNASSTFYGGIVQSTNLQGTVSGLTNGFWTNANLRGPTMTNGVNYGNAFRSPGSGTASEQFGTSASAAGDYSIAIGNSAAANSSYSFAVGNNSIADGVRSVAIGETTTTDTGEYATAVGSKSHCEGTNSTALGYNSESTFNNSSAIGAGAVSTAANQIRLGTATESVSAPGSSHVGGNLSVGHEWAGFTAGMDKGIQYTNSTAASANPTNGAITYAAAGELYYRASTASEGDGVNNRFHNRASEVVGSGSDYNLTDSYALVDFGGTDAELNTTPSAGTYLIQAQVHFAGCTAADDIYAKFYNATDAGDISNSEVRLDSTGGREMIQLSTVATFTAVKRIQIYAQNDTAARGTVTAIYTKIYYIRLH